MPSRRETPEETEAWLGSGVVIFGAKQPLPSGNSSAPTTENLPPEPRREDYPSTVAFEESRVLWRGHADRIQALAAAQTAPVVDPQAGAFSQQENLDQIKHDKMMLAMTDSERKHLARGLGTLMRSREASAAGVDAVRLEAQAWLKKLDRIIAAEADEGESGFHFNETYKDVSPEALEEPLRSEVRRQLAARESGG